MIKIIDKVLLLLLKKITNIKILLEIEAQKYFKKI
jgi:hypothetical protein